MKELSASMWDALDAVWRQTGGEPEDRARFAVSALALERRGLIQVGPCFTWRLTEAGEALAAKHLGDQPTGFRLRAL